MHALLSISLLVTVPLAEEAPRGTRAHDLSWLEEPTEFSEAPWPSAGSLLLEAWGLDAWTRRVRSRLARDEETVPPLRLEIDGDRLSPEAVEAMIRGHVAPHSWADERNSIAERENELVIVQTDEVQEEIARLLDSLRARRETLLTVDVACIPAAALGPAADDPAPWLPGAELDAALARAGGEGQLVTFTLRGESRARAGNGRVKAYLRDHQANMTGILAVIDPVVSKLALGFTAEVELHPIAGTDLFRVDVRAVLLEEVGPAEKREGFFGELELPRLRERALATTLVLPAGAAGLAGIVQPGAARRDFAVLARVRPAAAPARAPAAAPGGTLELRVYDASFLLEPFPGEAEALDPETLLDLVRASDPEAWLDDRTTLSIEAGGFLLATARAATHAQVERLLGGLARERAAVAAIDVRCLEGPLAEVLTARRAAEGGLVLPVGWAPGPGLREVFRVRLQGAPGASLEARSMETRRFIAELPTGCGTMCFRSDPVPEPVVQSAGEGVEVVAALRGTLDPRRVAVALELDHGRAGFEGSANVLLPADFVLRRRLDLAAGASGSSDAPRAAAWLPAAIDLPRQERRGGDASLALPEARLAVLAVEDAGEGSGRMLVAEVRRFRNGPAPEAASRDRRRPPRVLDLRFPLATAQGTGASALAPAPQLRTERFDWLSSREPRRFIEGGASTLEPSPETVLGLVRDLVAPDSWEEDARSLALRGGRLVVTQAAEILEQLESLAALLEHRALRAVVVDLALVPPEALAAAAPGALEPGASPWLDLEVFERAVAANPARAAVLSRAVREGMPIQLLPRAADLLLGDYEANHVGTVPVVEPVVSPAFAGPHAEARVLRVPLAGWLRVDLRLGKLSPRGRPERRSLVYGDLDLPASEELHIGTSLLVPEGKTAVAGLVALPAPGKDGEPSQAPPAAFAALVRVRSWQPDGPPAAPGLPRLFELGHVQDAPAFGIAIPRGPAAAEPPARADRSGKVKKFIDVEPPPPLLSFSKAQVTEAAGALFLAGPEAEAEKLRAFLEGTARESARAVTVDLWQGSAAREEVAGAAPLLDAAWRERMATRPGTRVRVTASSGTWASAAAVLTRKFVADVSRASGGNGSIVLAVDDPKVAFTGSGLILDVRATPATLAGEPAARLHLRGEVARPPRFGRQVQVPASRAALHPDAATGAPPSLAPERLALDLPEEDSDRIEHSATVPLGRPVLLKAISDPAEPGKVRALVALVHATGP
ncbi:MAG: hypothetical protein HY721_24275 [Planctomycetes bacterium]|nr:hypothetical protein [Planctomycetota bacterium]